MKSPEDKMYSMYGASKRLHDDMERADRFMLRVLIVIVAVVITIFSAVGYFAWSMLK